MQYSSLIYLKFKEYDAWERILGTVKVNAGNGQPASLLSFIGMGFLPVYPFLRTAHWSRKEIWIA